MIRERKPWLFFVVVGKRSTLSIVRNHNSKSCVVSIKKHDMSSLISTCSIHMWSTSAMTKWLTCSCHLLIFIMCLNQSRWQREQLGLSSPVPRPRGPMKTSIPYYKCLQKNEGKGPMWNLLALGLKNSVDSPGLN